MNLLRVVLTKPHSSVSYLFDLVKGILGTAWFSFKIEYGTSDLTDT